MAPSLLWSGKAEAFEQAIEPSQPGKVRNELGENLEPSSFSRNEHHIFVGDNLVALKTLLNSNLRYHFIYTDPPYNSGQQFSYLDKHGHPGCTNASEDAWLNMIYPRMLLAHKILRDNGVLFVSIDDREVGALTLVLREIFGRENHIGTLKWKKKRKPSFLDKHLGNVIEYILVFAKNAKSFPKLLGEHASDTSRPVLNASNAASRRVLPAGTFAKCPDGKYSAGVRKNKTLDTNFLSAFEVKGGRLVHDVHVEGRFRVSQQVLAQTAFITPKLGLRRMVLPDELKRKHANDNCTNWPTNEDAEKELRDAFGGRVFDYPKPVGMLTNLLDMCQFHNEENILCLDFFAGSASFSEAVIQQNNKDGANRFFTLAQNKESNQISGRFGAISDLTIARAKLALENDRKSGALNIYHLE